MTSEDAPAGVPAESNNKNGQQKRSEQKLERLLTLAAELMARKGYAQTSIRDVGRETGYSLAGMYYYFKNKEDLLFLIQHRVFSSLLEEQEAAVAAGGTGVEKLRRLVTNYLRYFTHHTNELKVCTFELQSLQGEAYQTIEDLRRRYYRCQAKVIADVMGIDDSQDESDQTVRHNTLFIFGMLNWVFMWFDPERDGSIEQLGERMLALALDGLPVGGPDTKT